MPDLFAENAGMVADSRMQADGTAGRSYLAKHDERAICRPQMGDMPKAMKAAPKARSPNWVSCCCGWLPRSPACRSSRAASICGQQAICGPRPAGERRNAGRFDRGGFRDADALSCGRHVGRTDGAQQPRLKPMLFKVAGAWGNRMKDRCSLWLRDPRPVGRARCDLRKAAARRYAGRNACCAGGAEPTGFFAFLLFSSNPFRRLRVT